MSSPDGDFQPTEAAQDDYVSRPGQNDTPVVSDSINIEDPVDANTADSDAQLGKLYSHTLKSHH